MPIFSDSLRKKERKYIYTKKGKKRTTHKGKRIPLAERQTLKKNENDKKIENGEQDPAQMETKRESKNVHVRD